MRRHAPPSPVCAPLPDVGGTLVRHQDPVLMRVSVDRKYKSINQMQLLTRKFNESKYVLTLTAQAVIHVMSLPMYYEMNPTFPALL